MGKVLGMWDGYFVIGANLELFFSCTLWGSRGNTLHRSAPQSLHRVGNKTFRGFLIFSTILNYPENVVTCIRKKN